MAANTAPIFSEAGRISTVAITAANVRTDGNGTVGTDIFLAFTPGADGSLITKAVWVPVNSTIVPPSRSPSAVRHEKEYPSEESA